MNRPSHGDTKKSRRHTLPFGSAQRVCCKYLFLGEWKTAPAARMERKTRPVCLGCCASNSHFARCPLRHQALVYAKPPRHWPASFLCCSRRNSSTTCSLNAKVRATRRSPSRRPLRFGMPSLRSFAARIRESQRKTARIVQSPGAYRWPSSDYIAVVSLESGQMAAYTHHKTRLAQS